MREWGTFTPKISPLAHMQLTDMRPKEWFVIGDKVKVIDRTIRGRIIEIDPDGRLAKLETGTGHHGWWYLKDLRH